MTLAKKRLLAVPLNRVEGDLELRLLLEDGVVSDAWSCGTMYRGFENLLKGRGPKDGLVLTPRVCGICGTAHLSAAAKALDQICGAVIPVNAQIVRNLSSMAEHLQSDMRHSLLMFMKDFAAPAYRQAAFYPEAVRRFEPFRGSSVMSCIKATKRIIEIIAIIGGQWPNSSYMVPGGVASTMTNDDVIACRYIVSTFRRWYEDQVLGCRLERWREIASPMDLEAWYEESENHRTSEIGFFLRCCRESGLDTVGRGYGSFISFGQFELPHTGTGDHPAMLLHPGFFHQGSLEPFDADQISEHVAHSFFEDYSGGLHPFHGRTVPSSGYAGSDKYSYTKAPRYRDLPAETGPLAELVCSSRPLFTGLLEQNGPSVMVRQLARFARGAELLPAMLDWLNRIAVNDPFYSPIPYIPDGRGQGLSGGCRGALGHWVEISDGVIERYQIITPTAWNGSPRDSNHLRGPWEEAVIGTPVADPDDPVVVGQIVRSFDACQVCSVHTVKRK